MNTPKPIINRRIFLGGVAGIAAAACSSGSSDFVATTTAAAGPTSTAAPTTMPPVGVVAPEAPPLAVAADPFQLGVASGDPLSDAVVLWTRLLGDDLGDGDHNVAWEVATDAGFGTLVAAGTVAAEAGYAHSARIDVTGLEPRTTYSYRFRAGDFTSPVGQTKTLPASGDADSAFNFVLATCQNYQDGRYAAWADVAARDDVDAIVFTGDYIYETAPLDFSPNADGSRVFSNPAPADLEGFRSRYAQTKVDPQLQAAHHRAPWLVMWDDHEVMDNYAGDVPGILDFAGGDLPARRAAAYQAWWEHQPVRLGPPADGLLAIHRTANVGGLIDLIMIDSRQFADVPPCRDTSLIDFGADCGTRDDPDRTLLGADQRDWLLGELGASDAIWTSMVSPGMFAGLDARPELGEEAMYYLESWDGYTAERDVIADALAEATNPVVLSGDYHASFALEVGPGLGRETFAPEFMAPGISSSPFADDVRPANPHVKHFAGDNGYVHHSVSAESWTATYHTVADVWDPASAVSVAAAFTVSVGDPVMREA